MKTPIGRVAKRVKKLPYLTEEQLNEDVPVVKIRVTGEYFKRGEHRQDVYEEPYEAEIVVPKLYNMGHVKLMSNRYVKDIKNKLNGVRVRTFYIDTDFVPQAFTEKKYRVRDFISDEGLSFNERERTNHLERIERKRQQQDAEDGEEGEEDFGGMVGTVAVQSRRMKDHNFALGGD